MSLLQYRKTSGMVYRMPTNAVTADGLRLRCDVWRRHCSRIGALTLNEKATMLGVDIATVSRMERGSSPSSKFIARALDALPDVSFVELFETVYRSAA